MTANMPNQSLTHPDLLNAYSEWLSNELSILNVEMGIPDNVGRFAACNTFAKQGHFPSGGNWREQPMPSTRAAAVMGLAGVTVPRQPSTYDNWRAAIDRLDAADTASNNTPIYRDIANRLQEAGTVDAVDIPDAMLRLAGAIYELEDGTGVEAAIPLLRTALAGLAAISGSDLASMRMDFYVPVDLAA